MTVGKDVEPTVRVGGREAGVVRRTFVAQRGATGNRVMHDEARGIAEDGAERARGLRRRSKWFCL